ncbi:MAG: lysylphosphatidylglycerol synthase transmembrane domain-containing protein [Coriobacteriia bacterium]|nr:lysylphosphatidylglycerol synthase transmembrane domain-containing protein [Coriobacteriia bacterium]
MDVARVNSVDHMVAHTHDSGLAVAFVMPRRQPPIWSRALISAVVLGLIIWWIGPADLAASLGQLQPAWMVAAIVVTYIGIFVGLLNVYVLTRALLPDITYREVAVAYLRSWAAGMLAPGKIGDLTYAHFLSSDDTNMAPGLAVGVVDKIVTFAMTSLVAVLGLTMYVSGRDAARVGTIAVIALAGTIFALRSGWLKQIVRDRLLGKYARWFAGFGTQTEALLLRHRAALTANAALTVIRIGVQAAALGLGLRAFGAHARLVDVFFINSIATLVSLVPITLAGLGVRQGVAILLFERIASISRATVLNEALVGTTAAYVTVALIISVFAMRRRS